MLIMVQVSQFLLNLVVQMYVGLLIEQFRFTVDKLTVQVTQKFVTHHPRLLLPGTLAFYSILTFFYLTSSN